MKEDKYTKSLVKNQVYATVHVRDIPKKCFTQIDKALYGDAMLVSLSRVQMWPPETKSETSVFEFFYLCVNSSLEELIKIKVISFLRQGMFR